MRTSAEVKDFFLRRGADLCGVASIDRFQDAPEGFHPRDVLPEAQSVVVVARRFPASTLRSPSTVPYTIVRNRLTEALDQMVFELLRAGRQGVPALPTGATGPTERDVHDGRMRNILSAKHAAQAAGLGVIGRNTLLMTPRFGNMVWLDAAVCALPLEPDPLLVADYCGGCTLCVEVCPVHAVGDPQLRQEECLAYAFGGENGGEWKIRCHRCRTACPHCLGTENGGGAATAVASCP